MAEAMALTRVEAFAGRDVGSLSGGERQRVWLAMLMAQSATASCSTSRSPHSTSRIRSRCWAWSASSARNAASACSWSCTTSIWRHAIATSWRPCAAAVFSPTARHEDLMRSDVLEAMYGLPMGILPHPTTGLPMSYVP